MKIYIIPCGWDRELVIKTAFKSGADKICLISAYPKKNHTYSKADKITRSVSDYLKKQLSVMTKVEIINVNYIDLKDIIIQIHKYINSNKGNEFLINISTGSHLLSAALFFVAQMNNIEVEYSIAKSHNRKIMDLIEKGENYHKGFVEVIRLPSIPFSIKFNQKELKIMKKLKENNKIGVNDFIENAKGNDENRLRSEFHYICKKLEKQGFVERVSNGGKYTIKLTDFGQLFVL